MNSRTWHLKKMTIINFLYKFLTKGERTLFSKEKVLIRKNWYIILDSNSKWIRQKFYQFFINEKFKKIFYFFTCILPYYVPHEITKEFWKDSHFEIVRADFLLRCQNSLRWEICLICHWNIDSWKQNVSFVYVMVSKYNQKII